MRKKMWDVGPTCVCVREKKSDWGVGPTSVCEREKESGMWVPRVCVRERKKKEGGVDRNREWGLLGLFAMPLHLLLLSLFQHLYLVFIDFLA